MKPMEQTHFVLRIASQGIVARRAFRGNSAFCILKQVLQCSGVTFLSTSADYISDCIMCHLVVKVIAHDAQESPSNSC